MNNNLKYLSDDGQYYDTFEKARDASRAWNKKQNLQKEQNKLLEQQNQLIMQQNENNNILARQKMQNEYEIEMEKLEIEKENNTQQLFNALSISKKTYDRYINKNYYSNENNEIRDKIAQIEEELNDYEKFNDISDEDLEDINYYQYAKTIYDECITIPKYKVLSKAEENKFNKLIILNSVLIPITVVFIMATFDNLSFIKLMIITILLLVIIFSAKFFVSHLSYQTEGTVNQYIKTHAKFDKDKFNILINKKIEQCNKELDQLRGQLMKNIQNTYDKFKEFRLNHYNKEIEQLLSDCGYREMMEDYGIEYQSVNNKNKIKDGTIEDYIVFFDEHIWFFEIEGT